MCSRFSLKARLQELAEEFGLLGIDELMPRYNIAPTQNVPIVRKFAGEYCRRLDSLRWGLVPSWANDLKIGTRMINARSETVTEKPAFREAIRRRRCLVPATGFYEWKPEPGAGGKPRKQPYLFHRCDDRVFAFAGLWDEWRDQEGTSVETFTILTTEPNKLVRPCHNRMPAIIDRDGYDLWLDPDTVDARELTPLLRSWPSDAFACSAVSTFVNNPRNEGPACIEPFA
ncbi:MAG: SOS response-associated peptidase [Phycisphaerales bacterium]|nr:SOS response-associated peptidase [Phycisphaerales bacterium]